MDVQELLASKRTFRAFLPRAVPDEVVHDILEAARTASCGANRQSLRYAAAQKPADVARLCKLMKWAAFLPNDSGAPAPAQYPTLFVVILQDTSVPGHSDIDVGIAAAEMTTAAWAHGVGSCIVGTLNAKAIAEWLGLPEHLQVHTGIAFGYPAHKSTVVPMVDGDTRYTRDANGDYQVPKRALEDIVRVL